jgi:hypothetical protein
MRVLIKNCRATSITAHARVFYTRSSHFNASLKKHNYLALSSKHRLVKTPSLALALFITKEAMTALAFTVTWKVSRGERERQQADGANKQYK